MIPAKEKKKIKKMQISRYNPSSRQHDILELEEVQVGVLKYTDLSDGFTCLIGIETENVEADSLCRNQLSIKKPRRISRIHWDTSRNLKPGSSVDLSPRDIAILEAILTYLKDMGFYIP